MLIAKQSEGASFASAGWEATMPSINSIISFQSIKGLNRTSFYFNCICVLVFLQNASDEQNLHELFERLGLNSEMPASDIREKLREIEQGIRKEIQTELKVKEGAENMRRAYTDRKSVANVGNMIKDSLGRIDDLNQELEDVRTLILMTEDGCSFNTSSRGLSTVFYVFWYCSA